MTIITQMTSRRPPKMIFFIGPGVCRNRSMLVRNSRIE
jgi:hypothetical protein